VAMAIRGTATRCTHMVASHVPERGRHGAPHAGAGTTSQRLCQTLDPDGADGMPRLAAYPESDASGACAPSLRSPLQPPATTPRARVGHAVEPAPAGADCLRGNWRRVSAGSARWSAARIPPGRGINRGLCTLQVQRVPGVFARSRAAVLWRYSSSAPIPGTARITRPQRPLRRHSARASAPWSGTRRGDSSPSRLWSSRDRAAAPCRRRSS
jgi:hypothetical protein